MPGDHADFAAYLAARWPSLVRTLILLGCDRREAEEVARTGAARCYGDWERVRRGNDVDAYVYGVVLARLHRHRRRVPQPPPAPLPDEPTDDELLREALVAQLAQTDPDERESLVLRFVAELDEAQVAAARDVSLDSAQARITHGLGRLHLDASPAETFRRAGESIEVQTTPIDDVVAEAQAQRRRRWRIAGLAVAVVAVVIGGLTWVTTREPPPPEDLGPAPVEREQNPVRVAWYANGRLHLEKVVVTVPALTDLIELNGGAVYGDYRGRIAFVAADGKRRLIGHKTSGTPLVASSGEGWAAWIDPAGADGRATLQVYDVSAGRLLASQDVPSSGVRPIAIDQRLVYFDDPDGTFAWAVGSAPPEKEERDGLMDVESANRVYQLDGRIEMVQSFFNVSYVRPGVGGLISPGGLLVLSKKPEPGPAEGRPFRPLMYDARSGDRKPTGVGPTERAVDATFGRNNTAVYLIAQVSDLAGGSDLDGNVDPLLVLRTCDLTSAQCTDVAPVPSGTDRAILAH